MLNVKQAKNRNQAIERQIDQMITVGKSRMKISCLIFTWYLYSYRNSMGIVSRQSGLNEGQPKSCFGSSMPNPMSFNLPTGVG